MKIFLGYPSEKLSEAKSIWEFLTSLGLAVWFDKENVVAGEEWRSAREKAQDAADLVIHVISSEVLTRSGEVQRELKRTLDLAKEKPFGSSFLIPVIVGTTTIPAEIAPYQYVDFERPDWRYRVAKGVARKFEQTGLAVADELSNFISTQSLTSGRVDLKIHDVTEARDLQSDYFKYGFEGRYFEFVNAEIARQVLSGYFEWRRSETTTPETDAQFRRRKCW